MTQTEKNNICFYTSVFLYESHEKKDIITFNLTTPRFLIMYLSLGKSFLVECDIWTIPD